jgi:phage gp29-like protein
MAMLYDQFGREVRVEKKPEMREVAVAAIRDRWSAYPSQGLTPQKLATIFKQADGGDIYSQAELCEEMEEKDTHLFSQLQTRKNAVLGLDYEVAPYSDSSEDRKIAEFVNDVFYNLNDFDDSLLDSLDAIGKGYSMCEIMWATDSRYAVIERMEWIHAKKAIFYDIAADSWKRLYQMPRIVTEAEPFKGEIMPPFKLMYHRYKARSGYDTRAGLLRVCAWMYLFKNYAIKDWVAFMEVFGIPLRLGKYDAGAGREDKDALIAAISSLGSDAAGIISKNTEIEFVEAQKGQSKENPFQGLAEFCDKQMSKAVVGQTASSEGTPGKLGNEDAQDKVRHDLIKADCEALAKTLRFQAIRPLVGYNFGWDKPLPWFDFKFEPPEDLKALSEVYKNLSEINYPLTVEHVSERFKVPVPEKGQTVLAPKTSQGAFKHGLIVAKQGRFPPEQENIEALVASTGDRSAQALSGLTAPIKKIIAEAESLEDVRDRIIASYSDMDKNVLADLLARAMFVAELYGRASVNREMDLQDKNRRA